MNVHLLFTGQQHAAFTDLIYYQQQWWCAFRLATNHMSQDGRLLVYTSADFKQWQLQQTLTWVGGDLRDPKFSITPNGDLLLTTGMRWPLSNVAEVRLYSVAWLFQSATQAWSETFCPPEYANKWRWSVTWDQQQAYSVAYAGEDWQGALYASVNGLDWQVLVKPFFPNPRIYSNESSLAFHRQQAVCIVRRDQSGGAQGLLGIADIPYTQWCWRQLAISVGAPKLLRLSNGEWVVAGRYINHKRFTAKMCLYKLNIRNGQLKLWRVLPSGGDCSYAGMVEKDGVLYVSYYSSHEHSMSAIYTAEIPLKTKRRSKRFV